MECSYHSGLFELAQMGSARWACESGFIAMVGVGGTPSRPDLSSERPGLCDVPDISLRTWAIIPDRMPIPNAILRSKMNGTFSSSIGYDPV